MKEIIEKLLKAACEAYYGGLELILSDEQYDRLSEMYKYETIGVKPSANTSKHLYQMYSLKKHFIGEGELPIIFNGTSIDSVESPKLDGCAISAYYVKGQFSHALTRGDGEIGQDVSDKIPYIHNIPMVVEIDHKILQVSGEVVVSKDIPNSRNYASGAMNLKSLEEFTSRAALHFYAYGVYPFLTPTYFEDMEALEQEGFKTVLSEDLNRFNQDGKVIRVNSNVLFSELGYTNHHPRGAIAVKERKAGIPTKLKDVTWQVGKTGRVTPVAILEPIVIDGATISKATLNNVGFIRAMNLHIGDIVEVIRSGDIIPTILGKWDE